jgi:uncharacterized membrane protein YedE/YeeE
MSDPASSSLPRRTGINPSPLGVSLVLILMGAWYLAQSVSPRQSALYVVGALLGVALYHAAFGFTSAWRVFIADGRGAGLRAQMLMLAVGVALFFPALSNGTLFGAPVTGLVSPAGTSVVVGAFIFGIGMQLGGGCASGTLYTVGGGSTRMIVTLIAFIAGSVIATAHMPFWTSLPQLKPVSSWAYWSTKANAAALAAPVSHDVTSVMDIGVVLGAMLAAALAGRYAPVWRLPLRSFVAAVVGGLLLGYGARLAYGCNIGAYFSGIVSGSLHGWLWLVAAFIGNVFGTRLRPLFGLEVERMKPTGC